LQWGNDSNELKTHRFPRAYWIYLAAVAFVAAGYVDLALIAYHLYYSPDHFGVRCLHREISFKHCENSRFATQKLAIPPPIGNRRLNEVKTQSIELVTIGFQPIVT
jgi:hypothetical protein